MTEKHWTDQPDEVTRSARLCVLFLNGTGVEVYIGDRGTYLVSAGNLFGSQTVRVPGSTQAFAVLQAVSDRRDRDEPAKLPAGWEIVANCDEVPREQVTTADEGGVAMVDEEDFC